MVVSNKTHVPKRPRLSVGGLIAAAVVLLCVLPLCVAGQGRQSPGGMERRVMAFYYPWYGTADGPGGAGRTVHWGKIDTEAKDIAASTHYPAIGAYDSHDPKLIDYHCGLAKQAKVDTLIVSWWGHGSFCDRAMNAILDGCARHGLKACIYYETVPRPQTEQSAARDIVRVLEKYAGHSAHLRIDGKPVVFVYGRALQELGLLRWLKAIEIINGQFEDGVTTIGDQFGYGAARVFDGLHTYNTAGSLAGLRPPQVRSWSAETYRSWVKLADDAGKICAITVIPGYDDTKIRTPGLAVERFDGDSYRIQWEAAIAADPHWVLITSFNEWHEGSEIEPSLEYRRRYIDLTAEYAGRFKASKRTARKTLAREGLITAEQKAALAAKLKGLRLAVLPGADSMAFWWLLDAGIRAEPVDWQQVAASELRSRKYDVALYCAGEHYQSSVNRQGDVDEALVKYLRAGGTLAFFPSLPWPCYYDQDGQAVNNSHKFGLTLRSAWERPPDGNAELTFVQPNKRLQHVPERFDFPTAGDLRWRPFFAADHAEHIPLIQLRDGRGEYLGDAVSYAKLPGGGEIVYMWFSLLAGPHAEGLLYDVFDFLAERSRSIR